MNVFIPGDLVTVDVFYARTAMWDDWTQSGTSKEYRIVGYLNSNQVALVIAVEGSALKEVFILHDGSYGWVRRAILIKANECVR